MRAFTAHRMQTQPHVAAHKLGLYTAADARKRRAIVKDLMRPREFAQQRYYDAREAMIDHLLDGESDGYDIFMLIEYLASGFVSSNWASQNAALCIESLGAFLKRRDHAMFSGFRRDRGSDEAPPVWLAGVGVDVQPELILHGENRSGKPIVGAIKLHLSKTQPLEQETGENIASLVAAHLEQHIARPGEVVSLRHCYVWDIFTQQIVTGPRDARTRVAMMEACCEEIAYRWRAAGQAAA